MENSEIPRMPAHGLVITAVPCNRVLSNLNLLTLVQILPPFDFRHTHYYEFISVVVVHGIRRLTLFMYAAQKVYC